MFKESSPLPAGSNPGSNSNHLVLSLIRACDRLLDGFRALSVRGESPPLAPTSRTARPLGLVEREAEAGAEIGADIAVEAGLPAELDAGADMSADLSTGAGDGDRSFRAYLNTVRQRARLDHAAELACFEQLKHTQAELRDAAKSTLIQSHLWLVPVVVRRYYRQGGSGFEDLVAEGNLGLYQALGRFDPSRGLRFSTYAKWWVTHAVTSSMAANAYAVRLPRRVALQLSRQRKADAAPGRGEGSTAGNAHSQDAEAAGGALVAPTYIDAPLAEEYDESDELRTGDENQQQPEAMLALKQGLQLLTHALKALAPRERTIIEGRYGLNGCEPRTLQEIAHELGLSTEGVRKIQLATMERLRNKLQAGRL